MCLRLQTAGSDGLSERKARAEEEMMSFFGKLKQGLGIGTAAIELTVPPQVVGTSGEIRGKLTITGKSDQKVKAIRVRLMETHTTGHGEDRKSREYTLGEAALHSGEPFDLKAAEVREFDFVLPFSLAKSSAQALADRGGALGALGKAAVLAGGEKSEFHVRAVADLENVALDPTDSKPVKLV